MKKIMEALMESCRCPRCKGLPMIISGSQRTMKCGAGCGLIRDFDTGEELPKDDPRRHVPIDISA